MPSDAEFCSLALIEVGHQPITSLTDTAGNKRGLVCAAHFPFVLDEIVREHPFNCTLVRQALAQDSTGPIFDYAYSFSLPTDPYCLRVWQTNLDQGARWAVEGRKLVTDDTPVSIVYGARITDVSIIDAAMAPAVVYLLASKIAYSLTGKLELAKTMRALYEDALKRAKGISGQEHSLRTFAADRLTRVR